MTVTKLSKWRWPSIDFGYFYDQSLVRTPFISIILGKWMIDWDTEGE